MRWMRGNAEPRFEAAQGAWCKALPVRAVGMKRHRRRVCSASVSDMLGDIGGGWRGARKCLLRLWKEVQDQLVSRQWRWLVVSFRWHDFSKQNLVKVLT